MKIAVLRRGGLASSIVISALAGLALFAPAASAAPTLGLSATNAVVGGTIEATAQLAESPNATGTISFEVFGPGDVSCESALSPAPAAATVDGEGGYTSGAFTTTATGTYRWKALYSGDSENEPAEAPPCTTLSTVAPADPSLSGVATSTVFGDTITDSATLSGGFAPSGQLVFRAFGPGNLTCSGAPAYEAQVPIADNGVYAPAGFAAAPGSYRWTVNYAGDANNDAASTPCGAANQTSTVSKVTPGLAGTATSSVKGGAAITDSVTISGGAAPTGQLVFKAFGPANPTCSGAPAYEESVPVTGNNAHSPSGFSPAPGAYLWIAEYSGDANNAAVSTLCGSANQTSTMDKATPALAGVATSVVLFGLKITDNATLSGGFAPSGQLVFRAYGPADPSCSGAPAYEEQVPVNGNANYAPEGFGPPPGLYLWTIEYAGNANNAAASSACGAANQGSAVGTLDVSLIATASDSTVGGTLSATATLTNGAIPGGQITFRAFPPGDVTCSGAAAFTSTVAVAGNGSYRSGGYAPNRVGSYRWTVAYSGDANHAPTGVGCGVASSAVAKATPTITGSVGRQLKVGTKFRDTVILAGGFAPGGTVTFAIYGPGDKGCAKPAFVNTVAATGNGTIRSDPFVAKRAGTYRFVATYSGDAANQPASEPCGSFEQLAQVQKRTPRLLPLARLVESHQVSIRARLSGAASPTGVITFRLFKPGDRRCTGKPAFSGSLRIKSNGNFSLAEYLATKRGIYRLGVGYSGDPRNSAARISCKSAQPISVG